MPELPEVETTRRGLARFIDGRKVGEVVLNRPDLRFPFQPDFRTRLTGQTILGVDRRAKYLIVRLSSGDAMVAHLGMSGSFRVVLDGSDQETANLYRSIPKFATHDHVILRLTDGSQVIYNDPRRFGFMFVASFSELEQHPRFQKIGVEPLEPPLDEAVLRRVLSDTNLSLKAALLDQRKIAGLGNIYVCEALHRARLSPFRTARSIAGAGQNSLMRRVRLARAIIDVLGEAIDAGGSSLRDFSGADGKPGYFQHVFRVYDREGAPCPQDGCNGVVERATQSGRSTFYCAACQK